MLSHGLLSKTQATPSQTECSQMWGFQPSPSPGSLALGGNTENAEYESKRLLVIYCLCSSRRQYG